MIVFYQWKVSAIWWINFGGRCGLMANAVDLQLEDPGMVKKLTP